MRSSRVIARLFLAQATLARAEVHAALFCLARLDEADDEAVAELETALADTERLVSFAQRAVDDADAHPEHAPTPVERRVLALLQHGPQRPEDLRRKLGVRPDAANDAVVSLLRSGRIVGSPEGLAIAG